MARVTAEVGSAANSYEILAKLAMGGMAEIFLARGASSAGVERYVVLKRILRHRANDSAFIAMFLDEARLAAQLQHPNIAQVYDIGKLGDSYFFTMEYVHGETVRQLLQRSTALRRPIPLATVLAISAGAAAGLHHAHERKGMDGKPLGIVHRDVSPSNLMISYEGTVKVVDFGVAKAAHRDHETRSGTVKGKISYMSPEQCRGQEIDRRSDLFSLGIVMWEMLTTEKLFRRNSDFENMQAIVSEDIRLPSQLRPDVPPELDALIAKLLAKNPADRFQSGDETLEAIETLAAKLGTTLSAASLGRYMRDLFGQRPEPWIELQASEMHAEPHTVTSDPLGSVAAYDELDRQLSQVPSLHQTPTSQVPISVPPPPPLTVPLRVQADVVMFPHAAPTIAMPARPHSPSVTPPSHPSHASHPSQQSHPSYVPPPPQYPLAAGLSASHSMPSYASHAPSTQPGADDRKSRLVYFVGPIVAVALGVSIALLVRGGGHDDDKHVAPPPTNDRTIAMTQTPRDADTAPADADVTADAVPSVDAAVAEVIPIDAAVKVSTPPPDDPHPRAHPTPPPPAPAKVDFAACAASSKTVAANATTCTLAACKAKDSAKAKKWLASVPSSKRAAVQKECGDVLPAAPCGNDFLNCRH